MSALLLLKLSLAPGLVAIGTLAGRKWGPRVGGFVAGFPNTAGPVIFLITLEQGAAFGARTAQSALLGLIALAAFYPAFAWCALRAGVALCLAAGWAAFIAAMLLLKAWDPPLWLALAAAWAGMNLARISLPRLKEPAQGPSSKPWDLPLRMAAAVALVLALTGAARILGPQWSGLLTPFPVTSAVLASFALSQQGPGGAERVLRGIVQALNSVALFMAILAFSLPRIGIPAAFAVALGAGAVMQVLVYRLSRPAPVAAA